jgi:5-methylcytosine-specific restriction endonuclease McrA
VSEIPARVRLVVRERDGEHCLRCGARGSEVHHRQRRREGLHGYANCITLCSVCHRWVHAHPVQARQDGLIVSFAVADVAAVQVSSFMGMLTLFDDGGLGFD